jgi:hypothetical protein
MKTEKSPALFLFLVPALIAASAQVASAGEGGGTSVGGGGAQIEASFRLKAYGLIQRIGEKADANALCSAQVMRAALDQTKISVVPKLIDPATGKPIALILDAWTVPNHIQLLQESWQNMIGVYSHPFRLKESVEVLILHEIYRSTGTCDDDRFTISQKAYSLISGQARSNYSEAFTFSYPYYWDYYPESCHRYHDNARYVDRLQGVCDRPVTRTGFAPGTRANCVVMYSGYEYALYKNASSVDMTSRDQACDLPLSGLLVSTDRNIEPINSYKLTISENTLKNVSPAHPFVLVHDIKNDTWQGEMQ